VLISLITLLTLLGIMLRPWKVSEAITALTGAGLLLILGLLIPGEALATLVRDWNTFFSV
jgi:arsenical pump membrane protein